MIGLTVLAIAGVAGILSAIGTKRWITRRNRTVLAVGLLTAAAGVSLVLWETNVLEEYWSRRIWPTTEGTVVASRVVGTRAFRPDIVYAYTVEGIVYRDSTTFDTPAFGGRNSKYNVAETMVKAYPNGRMVTVRFNPANPSESGLSVGPHWDLFGKIGLGGVMFGFGVLSSLLFMVGSRQKRSHEPC